MFPSWYEVAQCAVCWLLIAVVTAYLVSEEAERSVPRAALVLLLLLSMLWSITSVLRVTQQATYHDALTAQFAARYDLGWTEGHCVAVLALTRIEALAVLYRLQHEHVRLGDLALHELALLRALHIKVALHTSSRLCLIWPHRPGTLRPKPAQFRRVGKTECAYDADGNRMYCTHNDTVIK